MKRAALLLVLVLACGDHTGETAESIMAPASDAKCPKGWEKQGRCTPEPQPEPEPPTVAVDSVRIVDIHGKRAREVVLDYIDQAIQLCAITYYSDGSTANSCTDTSASGLYEQRQLVERVRRMAIENVLGRRLNGE